MFSVVATKSIGSIFSKRTALFHNSAKALLSKTPTENVTNLSNENDPHREDFFKYHWGHWLKNDAQEKAKRVTKFSVEGCNEILNDLYKQSLNTAASTEDGKVSKPIYNSNITVTLPHNVNKSIFGEGIKENEKVSIKTMESYHEGKHHHIFKISTHQDKTFVLRIPYPRDSEHTIATRLRSEIASQDFAQLKLKIPVPKVYAYGATKLGPMKSPFILEEFVEGPLLMREWNPMVDDSMIGEGHKEELSKVIEPLMKFQTKFAGTEFKKFGSLYFSNDLPKELREKDDFKEDIFEGEKGSEFDGRWKIGYTTERSFWRNGKDELLGFENHRNFLGPWNKASDIIKSFADLELATAEANKVSKEEIQVYKELQTVSKNLIEDKCASVPGWEDLLKPRLQHPDLDPVNCIVSEKTDTKYLLDFENTFIGPFLFNKAPEFIYYDGPKVYQLDTANEEFKKLDVAEQEQYIFAYKRTRNLFLWENSLNINLPKLIYSAAPIIKLLKSPFTIAANKKLPKDFLLIEEKLMQLQGAWATINKQQISSLSEYPIKYSKGDIEGNYHKMNKYNEELLKDPFATTQDWVPADMFETLVQQKVLIKNETTGDYDIDLSKFGF
ncbi:hypothetical protein HANVADRAFT_52564 [Hanseniaspora valbyensis NRRL Y-1626]|uniref:Altered inheritance of mitochondria protein 9, mitochondrial n=1 Tax=Hanseniaspora valbyensis NRRL Y-1626 TaxID=766949 RepID=A0A1B7TE22_9ASCO|nr:hypothetical protein HANVADRAFT_52564 [Hanseniaspora valbyensis NRRL Y-1626]